MPIAALIRHHRLHREQVDEEVALMDPRTRRFLRRILWRAGIAIGVVSALGVGGVVLAQDAADDAETAVERIEAEGIDRRVDDCDALNEFREVYRDDLARRAEPLDVAGIRSTPEYRALDDDVRPFVDYFLDTATDTRANAGEVRDAFAEQFPVVDCDELRARLEAEAAAGK